MESNINLYHRAFGQHSNIPDCCISFFTNVWQKMWNTGNGYEYRNAIEQGKAHFKRSWEYIPCPDCLETGYWQKLHKCGYSCMAREEYQDKYLHRKVTIC